jgi:hypothetical protein
MKLYLVLVTLACIWSNPVRALGQCSAWNNLMALADTMGTFGFVIDTTLPSGDLFVLYVDPAEDALLVCVGDYFCSNPVLAVTEDVHGSFVLSWPNDGYSIVVSCTNQAGGISVLLEEFGSDYLFALNSNGVIATDNVGVSAELESSGNMFWCGAQCPGGWTRVGQCFVGQTCCGYIYCGAGAQQLKCCGSGSVCNYDDTVSPPRVQCIASP